MNNLVGVFIKDEEDETICEDTTIYSFSLIFPGNKSRTFYLHKKEDKKKWVDVLKKALGYSNVFDYYEINDSIGKGAFGLVKAARHKKTGKKVAIKILSKKKMTATEIELQRRELEILKMC